MRTLMTLITIGAAGAGYVYLNQTPVAGEPYSAKSDSASSFNWNRDWVSKYQSSRVPAKDLINRIHEHTKSVFDEFANYHSGHSDAPVDDAFERLRQVAKSAAISTSNSDNSVVHGADGWPTVAEVPLPLLNELQRTAFDPAAESPMSNDTPIQTADGRDVAPNAIPVVKTPITNAVSANQESAAMTNRPSLVETNDASTSAPVVSNVARQSTTSVSKRKESTTDTKREATRLPVEWKVVGKTTEGRPMHSFHLGDGGTRTLVIAGLNGEDRTAVRWLELLADELASQPASLKNNEIVFFRAGNPDGLVQNKRDNSRGVPLNRNFPSRRYRPTPDMPKYAVPASEFETRVILDTLYTFRPRRVIHLASTSGRSQVYYNRSAKSAAIEFERSAKVSIWALDAEQYPGSIEDFSDGTLEAAVLSMRLSVGNDWQQSWSKLHPHVFTAVVGQSGDITGSDSDQTFDPDRSPIPPTSVESVSRRPRRRGYEELPPPPQ